MRRGVGAAAPAGETTGAGGDAVGAGNEGAFVTVGVGTLGAEGPGDALVEAGPSAGAAGGAAPVAPPGRGGWPRVPGGSAGAPAGVSPPPFK